MYLQAVITAAIDARVSTKDKGQAHENQLRELRGVAERLGYAVSKEYRDRESGCSAERPRFQQLFVEAHRRRFDAVNRLLSLDRLTKRCVCLSSTPLSNPPDAPR